MIQETAQSQAQPSVNLVYSAASDNVYFHRPNHLPEKGERNALGEDAARRLGLKPCPICIRREMRPQSPAEIERRGASESPK